MFKFRNNKNNLIYLNDFKTYLEIKVILRLNLIKL